MMITPRLITVSGESGGRRTIPSARLEPPQGGQDFLSGQLKPVRFFIHVGDRHENPPDARFYVFLKPRGAFLGRSRDHPRVGNDGEIFPIGLGVGRVPLGDEHQHHRGAEEVRVQARLPADFGQLRYPPGEPLGGGHHR